MVEKRTATYWHLMSELLYSGTQSTKSLWESGSRIDTPSQNVGNYCIGQLSGWVQVGRAHKAVMDRRVVLGEVVNKVSAAGFPINDKLALPGAVLDPIEVHVDGFGCFLFDRAVGKAFSGGVVNADWSRWLQVPKFCKGSAYRHGRLIIMEGGADFGFIGGRHHVVNNLGYGVDRAVDRGVGGRWLGRVSGLVNKELVATYAAASAGFGKVGGVTVELQYHVTGAVADGGVGVGRSIFEEPNGGVAVFLRCFRLFGNKHSRVNGDSIVK